MQIGSGSARQTRGWDREVSGAAGTGAGAVGAAAAWRLGSRGSIPDLIGRFHAASQVSRIHGRWDRTSGGDLIGRLLEEVTKVGGGVEGGTGLGDGTQARHRPVLRI
jgi:hypothetical protein